jgi:FAD synthase
MVAKLETEKNEYASRLHEQNSINDKFKNKDAELMHSNSLLQMENDIMGEKLKGIYATILTINNRKFFEERGKEEMVILIRAMNTMTNYTQSLETKIYDQNEYIQGLQSELVQAAKLRQKMKQERDKTFIFSKERLT